MPCTRTKLAVSLDFTHPSAETSHCQSTLPPIAPVSHAEGEAEHEFMEAMRLYKQSSGRMFPTWSEVLEVLQDLGYRKPAAVGH